MVCLLRDPLIRLVMQSDKVTDEEMIAVWGQLQRTLTSRGGQTRRTGVSACSPTGRLAPDHTMNSGFVGRFYTVAREVLSRRH